MKEEFRITPFEKAEFNPLEKKLYLKGGCIVKYEDGEITSSARDEIVDAHIDEKTGMITIDEGSEFAIEINKHARSIKRKKLIRYAKNQLMYAGALGMGIGIYKLIEYFSR